MDERRVEGGWESTDGVARAQPTGCRLQQAKAIDAPLEQMLRAWAERRRSEGRPGAEVQGPSFPEIAAASDLDASSGHLVPAADPAG